MTSALSSLTSSVLTSTAFSPIGLAVGPAGRHSIPVSRKLYFIWKDMQCGSNSSSCSGPEGRWSLIITLELGVKHLQKWCWALRNS
jgi:hypothetical protein